MTNDAERTEWSMPGATDVPMDALKVQLEVYGETILLRGFEGDTTGEDRLGRRIATSSPRHLGLSRGACPRTHSGGQAETGQWRPWRPPQVWPVALQREAFKAPARLRLPMPGLVFVCSPGRAPWVYAALSRPTDPDQHLYRMPAFNVFGDGRVCPGSHKFPEEVGRIPESFFRSFFSMTGVPQLARRSIRRPARPMGGD